jgi:hypothetical protein
MTPIFTGTIDEGKLLLDKSGQFKQYLATFPTGKRLEVTVAKLTHKRSNQQNKYYWSCVVAEIAKHTAHDPEQIHELLKGMFAPRWHYAAPTGVGTVELTFPTSTTRLDTLAFVEYTEKCRVWANEFLGLNIPLPGEVTF